MKCIISSFIILALYILLVFFTPLGEILISIRIENKYLDEIKNNPENINAYNGLLHHYLDNKKYEKAFNLQKRLIESTQPDANDYVSLADIYRKIDSSENAHVDSTMKYLKKAMELPELEVWDLIMVGKEFKKIDNDSLALGILNKALDRLKNAPGISWHTSLRKRILQVRKSIKQDSTKRFEKLK